MKTLVCLIALLSLASADAGAATVRTATPANKSSAKTVAAVNHKAAPATVRKASVKQKVRRKARRAPPKRILVTRRALPSKPVKRTVALRDDTAMSAPDHPGMFKAPGRAGWGVSRGGTETMVGLYTRPEHPDLPGPQIYHNEPRGAAGVSLSLKLGH